MKKSFGFTIVELAIIITVIGILAAITVFTYNGAQERAQRTKTVTAAKDYIGALALYYNRYGTYPNITGGATDMCLGVSYQSDSSGPNCITTSPNTVKLPTEQKLIDLVDGIAPSPGDTTFTEGQLSVTGVRLSYVPTQQLDGKLQPWWITYALSGEPSTDACPIGRIAYGDWANGAGNLTMNLPANAIQGDKVGDGYQCRVPLPFDR